jgi:hypothetical protein
MEMTRDLKCETCGQETRREGSGWPSGWVRYQIERNPAKGSHGWFADETQLGFCSPACADKWIREATTWPDDNVNVANGARGLREPAPRGRARWGGV